MNCNFMVLALLVPWAVFPQEEGSSSATVVASAPSVGEASPLGTAVQGRIEEAKAFLLSAKQSENNTAFVKEVAQSESASVPHDPACTQCQHDQKVAQLKTVLGSVGDVVEPILPALVCAGQTVSETAHTVVERMQTGFEKAIEWANTRPAPLIKEYGQRLDATAQEVEQWVTELPELMEHTAHNHRQKIATHVPQIVEAAEAKAAVIVPLTMVINQEGYPVIRMADDAGLIEAPVTGVPSEPTAMAALGAEHAQVVGTAFHDAHAWVASQWPKGPEGRPQNRFEHLTEMTLYLPPLSIEQITSTVKETVGRVSTSLPTLPSEANLNSFEWTMGLGSPLQLPVFSQVTGKKLSNSFVSDLGEQKPMEAVLNDEGYYIVNTGDDAGFMDTPAEGVGTTAADLAQATRERVEVVQAQFEQWRHDQRVQRAAWRTKSQESMTPVETQAPGTATALVHESAPERQLGDSHIAEPMAGVTEKSLWITLYENPGKTAAVTAAAIVVAYGGYKLVTYYLQKHKKIEAQKVELRRMLQTAVHA